MSNRELIDQIDEARDALIAKLRGTPARELAQRPAPGEWSVVENVRHLLFAEQLHLGEFLPGRVTWSRTGLRTDGRKRPPEVGEEPTDDLEEVLAIWDEVHSAIRDAVRDADEAEPRFRGNLGHLQQHANQIAEVLDAEG